MKLSHCLFALLAALAAPSCLAAGVTALSAEDAAKIKTIRVVSTVRQEQLLVQGDPFFPAWTGGYAQHAGLIPAVVLALIGSAPSVDLEQNTKAALAKYTGPESTLKFRDQFWSALQGELDRAERFRASGLSRDTGKESADVAFPQDADAVLKLDTVYSLAVNLRQILVVTTASLRIKGATADSYQTSYMYATNFVVPFRDSADKALAAWTESDAALLQTVLRRGAGATARMVRYDLLQRDPPTTPPEQYGFDKLKAGGLKADCAQIFEVEGEKAENVICRRKGATIAAGEMLDIARKAASAAGAPLQKP